MRIGTCSWKYRSWAGLLYSEENISSYLNQYSRILNTVEVDQWFWSLFPGAVALPKPETVKAYAAAVPDDFTFSVKVPNSITLTHHYRKSKTATLQPNDHFLSVSLFSDFLQRLEPMQDKLGPLMFQFEYLNREKMSGQSEFMKQFQTFIRQLPKDWTYALEIRNPNYLNADLFNWMQDQAIIPVLLQGYYMPSVFHIYQNFISDTRPLVFRLHGPDRTGIEQQTGRVWDQRVNNKDEELEQMAGIIRKFDLDGHTLYVNVNNHYEGSAPLTIDELLKKVV